jgi:hypothetical protein
MSYEVVQTDKGEVSLYRFVQEHFSRGVSASDPYSVTPGEYAVTIPLELFGITAHSSARSKGVFFTRSRIACEIVRDAVAQGGEEREKSMQGLLDGWAWSE